MCQNIFQSVSKTSKTSIQRNTHKVKPIAFFISINIIFFPQHTTGVPATDLSFVSDAEVDRKPYVFKKGLCIPKDLLRVRVRNPAAEFYTY